jgi:hypothetical protein
VEPLIGNIIDFAWDARGTDVGGGNQRLSQYRPSGQRAGARPHPHTRRREPDGQADKATVFAEGLNLATSIAFANGGVIVAQAPHMLFFRDTNGDDKAD